MSIYLLEPLDTQFYRSTLPFDAGIDGYATTEPLPWPRTIYGALRAVGFSQAVISLAITNKKELPNHYATQHPIWGSDKGCVIKGPFIFRRNAQQDQILLPMPADLVAEKSREQFLRHCIPQENRFLKSCSDFCDPNNSLGVMKVLGVRPRIKVESQEDYFLPSGLGLKGYLTQGLGNNIRLNILPFREQLLVVEQRVGIKRGHQSHIADEGMLYAAPHRRMQSQPGEQDIGFWVKIEVPNGVTLNLPENGVLWLGGESRPATYRRLQPREPLQEDWATDSRQEVINIIKQHGRFKFYLITPGLFEGRSHPFQDTGAGIFISNNGYKARLVGAALYKPRLIGGWDIQKGFPKPLERGVAAGGVYFFRLEDFPAEESKRREQAEAVFDAWNFKSLCSGSCEKEGFGIVLVGGWYV